MQLPKAPELVVTGLAAQIWFIVGIVRERPQP